MSAVAPAPGLRGPALTDAGFAAVASYLSRTAGLVFDASRRPALAAVVAERLEASGAADVGAYLARVSSHDGDEERQALLDAVVVPETHFFRNPPQMVALRRRILPELMRRAAARGRAVTIWSAGCSTGEEPYSLAMLAGEAAGELAVAPPVRVLATDISSRAVTAARRARYTGRSLALVTPDARDRWFEPDGDGYRVGADARAMVEVRRHNLVAEPPPFEPGEVDLVVCRNVTIYFGRETTRRLLESFHDLLTPGGYLLVGHAETLWQVNDDFTLVALGDAFAYRRDGDAVRGTPGAAGTGAGSAGPAGSAGSGAPGGSGALAGPAQRDRVESGDQSRRQRPAPRPASPHPDRRARPTRASAAPAAHSASSPASSPAPSPAPSPARRRQGGAPHDPPLLPVWTPPPGVAPPDPAAAPALLAAARDALAGARYAEAARLAARAALAAPTTADAYVVEGRARATVGDDDGALAALARAVALDPAAGHARFLLAGALARTGRGTAAAAEYRAAALALPRTPPADLDDLLDGCDVSVLVALCARLAQEAESGPGGRP